MKVNERFNLKVGDYVRVNNGVDKGKLCEVCFIDFMKDMPYREDENGNEDPYMTILIAPAIGEDELEGDNLLNDFYRSVSYKDIDIDFYKNEFEELY